MSLHTEGHKSLLPKARFFVGAWLVSIAVAAGRVHAMPALPMPSGAEVSALGDRLRINGQEARLKELHFRGSIDELFAYYRQQFGDTAAEPRNVKGQRILGGIVGDSYVTVQVPLALQTAARGSIPMVHARVMQTQLRPLGQARELAASTPHERGPMPSESRPLSDVESQDGQRLARLRVYANRHSLDANLAFVQREFEARGLAVVDRDPRADATHALLWFADARGGEAMVAVRSVGEYRVVTVHSVTELKSFEDRP